MLGCVRESPSASTVPVANQISMCAQTTLCIYTLCGGARIEGKDQTYKINCLLNFSALPD
jgi:hypothetical protein